MRIPFGVSLAVLLWSAVYSSPSPAEDSTDLPNDRVDDGWAEHALANPELDQGWNQSCRDDWANDRVSHCEVREFSYPRVKQPVLINGGNNGGMTVMGGDRDHVRILYRVIARARTYERARALTAEVKLEMSKGWLRPDGPETSGKEWWMVEVKAWVPRASDLSLRVLNGPLEVRDVRGTMILNATNGPVSLVDLAGAVEARVENGPLHVALAGTRWDGAGLDAEAQNGPLTLSLSTKYSAVLTTGTINGPRDDDYAMESNGRRGWTTTTLGKGGTPVRVVTHNGPFAIIER